MTEIKSLNNLRAAGNYANQTGHTLEHALCKLLGLDDVSALEIADALAAAIQQEVDEKCMLLPVDADGTPIHCGDEMVFSFGTGEVEGVGKGRFFILRDRELRWLTAGNYSHAKPRAVEDVLKDFWNDTAKVQFPSQGLSDAIEKYAAELRMRDAE